MIFHDSIYDGHHMMDWNSGHWGFGHWFGMVFGWGIIIFGIIIAIYMIARSLSNSNNENQKTTQTQMNKRNELKTDEVVSGNFETSDFCYNCGEQIDRKQLTFCPNCGTKI